MTPRLPAPGAAGSPAPRSATRRATTRSKSRSTGVARSTSSSTRASTSSAPTPTATDRARTRPRLSLLNGVSARRRLTPRSRSGRLRREGRRETTSRPRGPEYQASAPGRRGRVARAGRCSGCRRRSSSSHVRPLASLPDLTAGRRRHEETTDSNRGRRRLARAARPGRHGAWPRSGAQSEIEADSSRRGDADRRGKRYGRRRGLQFFLDGEPWRSMTISDPTGRVIVDVDAEGRLKDWGLTELFSESNEPPFDEVPLAEFKERFPEGIYKFVGTTIEGERLVGKARLSHDIPNGPEITSPADGAEVPGRTLSPGGRLPPSLGDRHCRLPGHRHAGGSAPRVQRRPPGLGEQGANSVGVPRVGHRVRARDPGDRGGWKLDVLNEYVHREVALHHGSCEVREAPARLHLWAPRRGGRGSLRRVRRSTIERKRGGGRLSRLLTCDDRVSHV